MDAFCSARSTATPSSWFKRLTISKISCTSMGARPMDGSSRSMSLGWAMRARPDPAPLAEAREVLVHPLEIPLERAPVTRVGARQEVLLHGQVLEDVPAFHHLHDAPPDDLRRVLSLDGLPEKLDAALAHVSPLRPQQSRDGLEGGALAGPVGPEEGDDTSLGDGERHPLQHEDDVIIDHLDVVDREQRSGHVASADDGYFSLAQSR